MTHKIFDLSEIFSDPKIHTERCVDITRYPTVHHYDHEAVSLINPDLADGPWIAGGSALKWYQNQAVGESDIDVFCKNAVQAGEVIERVKSYGSHSVKYQSDNAVTLQYYSTHDDSLARSWTIQIITRRYFDSMQDVIDNFDITVCQIGTCGRDWVLGKYTARDIRQRALRFNDPIMPDAAKRLIKYWTYGYVPVDGLIEQIQNNPESRWEFTQEEDYHNAF